MKIQILLHESWYNESTAKFEKTPFKWIDIEDLPDSIHPFENHKEGINEFATSSIPQSVKSKIELGKKSGKRKFSTINLSDLKDYYFGYEYRLVEELPKEENP